LKDHYSGPQPDKISIIWNGIDFEDVEKNSTREDDASVLCHCRLYLYKGIIQLIKALTFVKEQIPTVHLDIYGEGPAESRIRDTVSSLNLESRITLNGFLPRTEVLKKVSAARVVVLPSFHETGPFISALEAMALKKPVIALDLPFAREFIHHMENGLLAMPGNCEDLARNISLLLSNQQLRYQIAQNGYEYVKKHHNWNLLVQDYIRLYETLASDN